MAARVSNVFMRNFPILSSKLSEGILTRADKIGPNGGIIEGTVSYAAPVEKGDLIELEGTLTDKGVIQVAVQVVDAEGRAHGVVVSEPFGIDGVTVSGQVPTVDYRRMADVAFFGLGVIELVASAHAAIEAGASLALHKDVAGEVIAKEAHEATTLASNGGLLALTYAAAGEKVAVLVNSFHAVAE